MWSQTKKTSIVDKLDHGQNFYWFSKESEIASPKYKIDNIG